MSDPLAPALFPSCKFCRHRAVQTVPGTGRTVRPQTHTVCIHSPPVPVPILSQAPNGGIMTNVLTMFPVISDGEVCGQFSARAEAEVRP